MTSPNNRLEVLLENYLRAQTDMVQQVTAAAAAVVAMPAPQQPAPQVPGPWPGNRPPPPQTAIDAARRYNALRRARLVVDGKTRNNVTLRWIIANAQWNVARIERSLTPDFQNVQQVALPQAGVIVNDANLAPDTRYFYRLVIDDGNEENEIAVDAKTLP